MNKIFTTIILGALTLSVKAQTPATVPTTQLFGKIDKADLEMKACDFEKDANAEVLFDKHDVYFGADLISITDEIHRRIKIFNDNGKSEADIRIPYYGGDQYEYITGLQAETINLVNGNIEITKLDKKLIYSKVIDKERNEITFTMPNVKPGCVIEYKYKWTTNSFRNMPDWECQEKIPVRYSEFNTQIPDLFYFRIHSHLTQQLVKHSSESTGRSLMDGGDSYPYNIEIETRGLANIPSLVDEPYMSSFRDNAQALRFQFISVRPIGGFTHTGSDTWAKVGGTLVDDDDFGGQLRKSLTNEDAIINKAKALKTDDEKIAYIFNEVKNDMKWNGRDDWYTVDGTYRAWTNKTGNSTEINLILCHLLKAAGVEVYPMVVSTKEHGKVDPLYTSVIQFNKAVAYIPVDSAKNYILDATGKYNLYNETPADLLNSSGLYVDKKRNQYDIIYLHRTAPVRQAVLINAEIKPNGKMAGTAQISSISYNRINAVAKYKTDGEKKYIDYLQDGDNNLKISSIKFDNMEIDSLPLTQNINFNLDLTGSDENYIYFNPNLFTSLHNNPFLSENRATDIDFEYLKTYIISGIYKMPAGYKIDALPKSVNMTMPDKSIVFKRIIAEQDGSIIVRYTIDFKKDMYFKNNYPDFHDFFKKMHEMLNEQIVLKKL